ncbi:MAG: hypothetical protein LBU51_11325, partial [Bacteroidales bacterium]|nr:hypothetical protein [Bacteroidales bacterium]
MMKKKILLFLLLSSLALLGLAQEDKPLRIELETAKDINDYSCVPVAENGMIVFYEGNQLKSDSIQWIIMHYDTNLHKTANYQIFFPKTVDFVMSYYDRQNGSVFLLFQTPYQKKEPFISYLVEFNLISFQSTLYTIDELKDQSLFFLKIVDSKAIMVSFAKEKYDIYLYDLRLKSLKSPLFSNNQILSVEFCEADTLLKRLHWGII